LFSSKVNLPTLQVHYEGVDYQQGIGPHGCEVPLKIECARQSLPVPLRVMMMMMMIMLTFYTIIVMFFCA